MKSLDALRLAGPDDAEACREIYRPAIETAATSFETEVPSEGTFAERIVSTLEVYPWLVAVADGGDVAGYASACRHRERQAYQWCAEVSAYVSPQHFRRGVGRRLYETLFACLSAQGFHNAYAGITLPNDTSVAFHEALGFEPVGVYRDIGFKMGVWHDVGWWALRLRNDRSPQPPRALADCRDEIDVIVERS